VINEHDIRDFDGQKWEVKRNVKLYEVPRNSWIYFDEEEDPTYFHHTDGMYSLCEKAGDIFHPVVWSVVSWLKPYAPESP
jgi:hypothetical protein